MKLNSARTRIKSCEFLFMITLVSLFAAHAARQSLQTAPQRRLAKLHGLLQNALENFSHSKDVKVNISPGSVATCANVSISVELPLNAQKLPAQWVYPLIRFLTEQVPEVNLSSVKAVDSATSQAIQEEAANRDGLATFEAENAASMQENAQLWTKYLDMDHSLILVHCQAVPLVYRKLQFESIPVTPRKGCPKEKRQSQHYAIQKFEVLCVPDPAHEQSPETLKLLQDTITEFEWTWAGFEQHELIDARQPGSCEILLAPAPQD